MEVNKHILSPLASEGTDARALLELALFYQIGKGKHKVHVHFDRERSIYVEVLRQYVVGFDSVFDQFDVFHCLIWADNLYYMIKGRGISMASEVASYF